MYSQQFVSVHDSHMHVHYCTTENEIDGETLSGVNDHMVERLFGTMKQQVAFNRELKSLMQSSVAHGYVSFAQQLLQQKLSVQILLFVLRFWL